MFCIPWSRPKPVYMEHRVFELESELLAKDTLLEKTSDTLTRTRLRNQRLEQENADLKKRLAVYDDPFADVEKLFE